MVVWGGKHAFWQALVFTVIVFGLGLLMGYFLELSRARTVQGVLFNSEINLLDEQLSARSLNSFNTSCEAALQNVLAFADRIYLEAVQLEEYDAASKFDKSLALLHRRYDLLRFMLWLQAIELKRNCESDVHTVVYLYEYGAEDITTRAYQATYSRLLTDVKEQYAGEVILIPLAVNTDLHSVDLALSAYSLERYPAIIIDETHVLSGMIELQEIQSYLDKDGGRRGNALMSSAA
ncbi:MAG TPA: hypothetical protein VJK51_05310 [Candidatus Nanoarchaeia archaeon]|nr:hypothetical protein [Candidatus Nanoarchaeia archaeon]